MKGWAHIWADSLSIRWEYREETNTSALPAGSLLNSAKRGYHRESGELQKKSVLPGSFISSARKVQRWDKHTFLWNNLTIPINPMSRYLS